MKNTDNGFLKLDNAIIDYWMSRLNHSEFKTLLVIYRKTVGWNKQYDKISHSQIAELTGLTTRSVRTAITSLERLNLTLSTGSERAAKVYSLNINKLYDVCLKSNEFIEMEIALENISQSKEVITNTDENNSLDDAENFLHKRPSKDTNNKQVKNMSEPNIPFSDFWNRYDYAKGQKSSVEAKWLSLTDEERTLTMQSLDKYLLSTPDKTFRKYPMTYLNTEAWNDEIIIKDNTHTVSQGYSASFKLFDTNAHNHTSTDNQTDLGSESISTGKGLDVSLDSIKDVLAQSSQVHWSELKAKGLLKKQVNPSAVTVSESKQQEIDDFLARNSSKRFNKGKSAVA